MSHWKCWTATLVVLVAMVVLGTSQALAEEARGKFKKVDVVDSHIVVTDGNYVNLRFDITPRTKVRVGTREGDLADLKVGDPVAVVYEKQGDKNVAILIGSKSP
jgi:Cu/Ag efflux protein CusF